MTDFLEIRGGASEFEAAVIAVVLDQIEREREQSSRVDHQLPAWIRAAGNHQTPSPAETIRPR